MWIGHFPAFVNPESTFTLIGTFRFLACFDQWVNNRPEFFVHFVDMKLNCVEMNFTGVINHTKVMEQAVHVALHCGIFVHLTITEFFDGLCTVRKKKNDVNKN